MYSVQNKTKKNSSNFELFSKTVVKTRLKRPYRSAVVN